jgi:adenosylcobinamide-GDP ribazoletransferase
MTLPEEARRFLLALQFLTRIPLPVDPGYSEARLAASVRYYPAVGALIGIATGAVLLAASAVAPPALAALAATATAIALTGGLHEDGLADTWDALGGSADRNRALQIMRDSRIGSYGALALILAIAARVLVLAALPPWTAAAALVAGHAASRASIVVVIATSRYARTEGSASALAGSASGTTQAVAAAGAALAMLPMLAFAGWATLGFVLGLAAGHIMMRRRFEARLGGYTGDCLGAVQQTSEIGALAGLVVALPG